MTEPQAIAKAEQRIQDALSAEGKAVMAHTAREAEHGAAQQVLKSAQDGLKATGTGGLGRGNVAAKSVLKWNPAKAGVQKEAIELAEAAAKSAPKAAGLVARVGGTLSVGAKLVTHAGAFGAIVSGTTQYFTDRDKVNVEGKGHMTSRRMWTGVGVQAANGAATGLAGAAAGAWAGAELGGAIGAAGGPLGLLAGAATGAVVGTAVSLGAGVVLDKAEHFVWHHWTPHAVKEWFKKD